MQANSLKTSEIKKILEPLKKSGKKIVMTNGCFDILHIGHKRYLEKSKALGDVLVVALNSDKSVKKIKGNGRPINNELDRAELLLALKPVDYVVIFDEDTAESILKEIDPDIYTKGSDYQGNNKLPELKTAQELGAQVAFIDLVEGKSTTNLINKIEKGK